MIPKVHGGYNGVDQVKLRLVTEADEWKIDPLELEHRHRTVDCKLGQQSRQQVSNSHHHCGSVLGHSFKYGFGPCFLYSY